MSLQFKSIALRALCMTALGALLVGCGTESEPITSKSTKYEVGDEAPGAAKSSDAAAVSNGQRDPSSLAQDPPPPPRPKPMNDAAAVASKSDDTVAATPEQLLSLIRRLRQQEPKGNSEDEVIANFISLQTQVVQAVDELIALKPADDVVIEAASAKVDALSTISRLGAEGAMEQLFAFTEKLEQHPREKVSKFGRQQSFVTLLNAFSTDQVTDSQQVIDAFKKLSEEQPKEGGLLQFGRDVATRFMEKGLNDQAAELLRYTAASVQPTDDPQLAAAADSLIEQARFAELDLGAKLTAVAERKEGAIDEFITMLGELTSGERVGATTLSTITRIASMLEGEYAEAAAKVYDVLEAASGKISDQAVAADIEMMIDKYRRRAEIVGKPFLLEGVLLDGTPFDWNQYKGKVVLIDFWATWCGPCMQEMPNIRANFEKYRDRGFEVVGVNIDEDVAEYREFSSLQPLPWPSVLSADPDALGFDHPMAERYGVAAIPFLVLVDREGVAIALNTRGPALGEKLAELFPDAAAPGDKTPAEEPAKDKPDAEQPAAAAADPPAAPAADGKQESAGEPAPETSE